ncbi:MAG: serine O-acetyltransferase [Atopobiaceae bacterium]|jgi:serine O-acetyltransferase
MFDNFREDIEAFRLRDPAATSNFSIWLNSPGMRAIWAYRRQHWWWEHGHPLLARWLSTRSRRKFGVEIHPGATIGRRFIIDHGMGIVVGETTIIGDDCMIYQGVTLGGTGKQHGKRHPTLGDGVVVGVGASVLGDIHLGDRTKIGAGAVVVHDVPADCTVVGVPGHVTTMSGIRIRSAHGTPLPCPPDADAATVEKAIADVEDQMHVQYLPDPLDETVDALVARLDGLERKLSCLHDVAIDEGKLASARKSDKE